MKMKLEVGMYVRIKDKNNVQFIRKIVEVSEGHRKMVAGLFVDKSIYNTNGISLKNVVKANHNIIDLIEVGDYVNGRMIEIIYDYNEKYLGYKIGSVYVRLETFDIKSIVTKEQFEQM